MRRTAKEGRVCSVYLDKDTWENLDRIVISNKVGSRSEMIELLISWEMEKIGFSTEGLEELQSQKEKLLSEAKKIEEKYERIKLSQPLINIKKESLKKEYEETIITLVDNLDNRDRSIDEVERIAYVRSRVYLNCNWTGNELLLEALKRSKKYKNININPEVKE